MAVMEHEHIEQQAAKSGRLTSDGSSASKGRGREQQKWVQPENVIFRTKSGLQQIRHFLAKIGQIRQYPNLSKSGKIRLYHLGCTICPEVITFISIFHFGIELHLHPGYIQLFLFEFNFWRCNLGPGWIV